MPRSTHRLPLLVALLVIAACLVLSAVAANTATFLPAGVVGRPTAGYGVGVGGQTVTDPDVSSVGDINSANIPRAAPARPVDFPSENLPFTGSSPVPIAVVAGGMLLFGAAMVRAARRRGR